ncbi:MAG: hypothetical protein IV100_17060 [Myxococcales bacterium]|nr:hypothetical protein [Myxococcales bacterium]
MRSERALASALTATALLSACGENLTPTPRQAYSGDAPALTCLPNLDGVITSSELGAAFGVTLSFLISPDGAERPVPQGEVTSDGQREWDFGSDYADDEILTVGPQRLETQWYRDSFPEGEIVLPADPSGATVGIYRQDEQAFWLLGSASADPNPPQGRTLLVYTEPVALFHFPIEAGAAWVSQGEIVQGELLGLPFTGRHTYEVEIVDSGRLLLPQLTFTQVLRARTRFIVEPAIGSTYSLRQTGFLFECFGEVARATSRLNEPDADFTVATELRRVGQNL